jgi:hypothetical protein
MGRVLVWVAAIVLALPEVITVSKWHWRTADRLLQIGEHVQFVAEHFSGVREVWSVILDLPGWVHFLLFAAGIAFISWDLRRTRLARVASTSITTIPAETSSSGPKVTRWLSPLEAIDAFTDRRVLDDFLVLKAQSDVISREHSEVVTTLRPPDMTEAELYARMHRGDTAEITALRDKERELSRRVADSQVKVVLARQRVIDDIILKLRNNVLVARGVLFENNKLYDDWEYLKPAHWVALKFNSYDSNMETVTGGGKTYKGLQIGKREN